jgi:ABC-2 type transport system ATP-binding protein
VDDAAEVVRTLAEVREVSTDGRLVRSRVADGARAVPTILAALDGRGIAVESVTMHRPSLDDVYLHYTGRDFRAEDEAGGEG